jgi:Tol biopolymer transport system component
MTLAAGSRLGSYQIVALLGSGGMGEVHRALDTRLGREVAIKVITETLAAAPEHLARFEREARLLASVNHPAVAGIYGVEEIEGRRFLVLELVSGETLEERLGRGPLPLEDALEVARQVAEALKAAHEKGIVHRDLKPSNIKLTPEGKVKVLDFGLAKTLLEPGTPPNISSLPTLAVDRTQPGTILGTPAYMSPEQARGKPVDKRSDIWSFGCILYALLTGRKAFPGETISDTIAAVLGREPDWARLPSAPPRLRRLLGRCFEKDRERRLDDAGDALLEIEGTLRESHRPGGSRARGRSPTSRSLHRGGRRRELARPKLSQVTFREAIEEFPAWSSDGTRLVYCSETGGFRKLFLKRVGTGEERQLTHGDTDDIQPAWSADDRTIAFVRSAQAGARLEPGDVFGPYEAGDLWGLDLATGKERKLVDNAFNPSYSPDGTRIAVDASWVGPRRLWIVDAQGRNPQQATSDDSEAMVHLRPRWSPDGGRLVFQNLERTKFDVRVAEVKTRKLSFVTNDLAQDIGPVWSPSGRFIYFSSYRSGGLNLWRVPVSSSGRPSGRLQQLTAGPGQDVHVAVSGDGRRLAFAILRQNAQIWRLPVSPDTGRPLGPPEPVIATTREDSRGAWAPDGRTVAFNSDRTGEMNIWLRSLGDGSSRQLTQGPGGDFQPNWAPDGRRLAFFSSRTGSPKIWLADLPSGTLTQLTREGGIDANPFFSPDGTRIAYQSDQGGRFEVWVMKADGTEKRRLTRVGVMGHFMRWTHDGRAIVFRCPAGGKSQTLQVTLDGDEPQPLAEVAGGSHMSFSPDGSSIMDVVGHKALWVSPLRSGSPGKVFEFDDPDVRIDYPVWSPDGHRVLFDRFRPQGGNIWLLEGVEA